MVNWSFSHPYQRGDDATRPPRSAGHDPDNAHWPCNRFASFHCAHVLHVRFRCCQDVSFAQHGTDLPSVSRDFSRALRIRKRLKDLYTGPGIEVSPSS